MLLAADSSTNEPNFLGASACEPRGRLAKASPPPSCRRRRRRPQTLLKKAAARRRRQQQLIRLRQQHHRRRAASRPLSIKEKQRQSWATVEVLDETHVLVNDPDDKMGGIDYLRLDKTKTKHYRFDFAIGNRDA